MSRYRGFTVSFNAIGAGKILRKYLVLASQEMLAPLLHQANVNMVEAKCHCQIIMNTRALFRKGAIGTWIKFQMLQVIAPSNAKHVQAKRMLEGLLPGGVVLEEYKDTAKSRLQCNEFVPDNKHLVFNFHRNGITHYQYGEVQDLYTPSAPLVDKKTGKRMVPPWKITKREHQGVALPSRNFPLQRQLNIVGLLDMLLFGVEHTGETVPGNKNNAANVNNAFAGRAAPRPLAQLQAQHRRPQRTLMFAGGVDKMHRSPPVSFGLV